MTVMYMETAGQGMQQHTSYYLSDGFTYSYLLLLKYTDNITDNIIILYVFHSGLDKINEHNMND